MGIPWKKVKEEWEKDPRYVKACNELQPYFNIGDNILRYRINNKISISEFAEQAQVNKRIINKIESCIANPRLKILIKIADAMGISIAQLLTEV